MQPRSRSFICLTILLIALVSCSRKLSTADKAPAFAPLTKDACVADGENGRYGGRLVYAAPLEPKTFNRLLAKEQGSFDIAERIHASLFSFNRIAQMIEPGLAKSWQFSDDHRTLDVQLRREVRFSDGHPFTADDVIFTFAVLLDPKLKLSMAASFMVDGQPVLVEKSDTYAVRLRYPKPIVTAERDLTQVAILPQHKLEIAYRNGRMESTWNAATPPAEVVGLGPFKLKEYIPGQRLTLERNLHYWKVDKAGVRLPYLDALVVLFIPDANTRLLRFESGELDMHDNLRPEDFASLQRTAARRGLVLADVGPDISSEFFWFNMNPGINPETKKPYLPSHKYRWFSDVRFRRAISHAIDRTTMIRVVFMDKAAPAYGPFNSSNKLWADPTIPKYDYDPTRAKVLLQDAGFIVRDGIPLQDRSGQRVEFSLVTNADSTIRQKMAALIQQDLAKLGITVRLSTLELSAIAQAIGNSNYEACLLGFRNNDIDPSAQQSVWMSNAPMHPWYPNQKTPATEWERRLDACMSAQLSAVNPKERKRLIDDVQQIIAENAPIIYLVSKDVLVGAKNAIGNFRPSVLDHHTLWNCETLFFRSGA